MTSTLILLRHGETDGNLHRIVQTGETPLNERGLQQAALAADRVVTQFGNDLVIRASDYARAYQTAQALSQRSGCDIDNDPLLRERNLGTLRGRPYAELGFDPFAPNYHPPDGESWQQFFARVARLWNQTDQHLDAAGSRPLVLVTHGLVLRAVAQHHLTAEHIDLASSKLPADPLAMHWPNTSIIALRRRGREPWTVLEFNCAKHLDLVEEPSHANGAGIA